MQAVLRHVHRLWGPWWLLPALPLLYAVVMLLIGDLRPEHAVIGLLCTIFAFATTRTKQFFVDVSPYLIVAFGYDLVRYARRVVLTPERVLGCELRDAELALFSVGPGTTPQDWFASHHWPVVDLICAVPYTVFVYVAFIYAAYLYFADRPRMRRYLWSFAIANYISFTLWLIVPAAPPWYIRANGCAIDLSAAPSAAALLRVDQLFGIHYFETFYSRAASVFGAMPSMHCAYPLIGLLTAWRVATWRTRPVHVIYTLVMFAAAVYLDHHWILDALAGWAVALVAVFLATRLTSRQAVVAPAGPSADPSSTALLRSEAQ
ncbi:MAG TPA: phosphatase PAP2 family protein [Polyangiaceae bacterium]|nr:phosphatase PAP2 family protein [Polyangiaceae bacterium]